MIETDGYYKKADSVMVNASSLVFRGACLVFSVVVTGDGVNSLCDVFDGFSDTGLQKLKIRALANSTMSVLFPVPIPFDNGLYVKVDSSNCYCTVQFKPLQAGHPE